MSKCELSRWSTVNDERRRGTFTLKEDPRAERFVGGVTRVAGCWVSGLGESSGLVASTVAELCLALSGRGFLISVEELLPMLSIRVGDSDSS